MGRAGAPSQRVRPQPYVRSRRTSPNRRPDPADGLRRASLRPSMTSAIATGPALERVLDGMDRFAQARGLNRHGNRRLYAAQMKTDWGKRCQRLFTLTDGGELLASAAQYDLTG